MGAGGGGVPRSPGVGGGGLTKSQNPVLVGPKYRGGVQIKPNFVKKMVQRYQKQPKLAFGSLFHSENTQIYRAKSENFALFEVFW